MSDHQAEWPQQEVSTLPRRLPKDFRCFHPCRHRRHPSSAPAASSRQPGASTDHPAPAPTTAVGHDVLQRRVGGERGPPDEGSGETARSGHRGLSCWSWPSPVGSSTSRPSRDPSGGHPDSRRGQRQAVCRRRELLAPSTMWALDSSVVGGQNLTDTQHGDAGPNEGVQYTTSQEGDFEVIVVDSMAYLKADAMGWDTCSGSRRPRPPPDSTVGSPSTRPMPRTRPSLPMSRRRRHGMTLRRPSRTSCLRRRLRSPACSR